MVLELNEAYHFDSNSNSQKVIEPKTVWGTSITVDNIETESSTVTEMHKTTEAVVEIYKTITIFI